MSNTYWDGQTWPPPNDVTPAEVLTAMHLRILALESAFKLVSNPVLCVCGWRPVPGAIGTMTLDEHRTWCSVYQNSKRP